MILPNRYNLELLIDDEDLEKCQKYTWHLNQKDQFYFKTDIHVNGIRKKVYLHRLIMGVEDRKIHVDHINGNVLDNRKSNLRLCNHRQNLKNQHRKQKTKSGIKGVFYREDRGKYSARITVDYKNIHLGTFLTAEEATEAYNKAAILYHKDFASINKEK